MNTLRLVNSLSARRFLLGGAAFLAIYTALLPYAPAHPVLGGIAYPLVVVVVLAFAPGTIALRQGRERLGWMAIAAMLVTWGAAELVYSFYTLVLGIEAPLPSIADAFYYIGYIALVLGVVLLTNTGRALRDWRSAVDGATVSLVAGAFVWHFLAQPAAKDADGLAAAAVALGYPLLDLALACALIVAYVGADSRWPRSIGHVFGAIAVLLFTDTIYGLSRSATVAEASLLDVGWLAGYVLIGAALLQARTEAASAGRASRDEGSFASIILPHATVLPLVVTAIVLQVRGVPAMEVGLAAIAAMALLALRQVITLVDNRGLYRASRERAEQLQVLAVELERQRQAAAHLAAHDPLTGLLNRRAWFGDADSPSPTAVILLDVDYFKSINDRYGHPAGDAVLRTVAQSLGDEARGATVARLGGEEFGVMLLDSDDPVACARRMVARIASAPVEVAGVLIDVTVSAGVAEWRGECDTAADMIEALYREADRALYEAKAAGRSRVAGHIVSAGRRAA